MKIDGRRYAFHGNYQSKRQSQSVAKSLREDGYSVRVKRVGGKREPSYDVWYSPRPRRK